jgi:alkylation response protein AidB-like acyl-CoA dehydrogenase
MTTEPRSETRPGKQYSEERVDSLPFNTPEKSTRYDTERFPGGIGLNWYECDPTLQRSMKYYLTPEEYRWAEPRLIKLGELMGGPIAERADITDKNPPQLIKYDRWGHDISEVIIPESARATKRDLAQYGFMGREFEREAQAAGVPTGPLSMASGYLLNQAEIGMSCAMGADAGMVEAEVARYAPPDIQEYVLSRIECGEWLGSTGQFFTERTGGSDLGGLETTATRNGDSWTLNGFKWFCSNLDGEAFVVLAKPEGAADSVRGIAPFLVLKYRRDGSRNGMKIRQLKDKLGTKAVASGEVEFVDAEAFMLSGPPPEGDSTAKSDGKGMARLMMMTNVARLGVSLMGLGAARRSLVESLCYTRARNSWGTALIDHPLMKRKLAEMIVDVEAVQALLFEAYGFPNHQRSQRALERSRLVPPLAKLKAARLGITTASDGIEIHGGNGYIETWPMARVLRDAHVNTLWEGPDNILCLDVRRAIRKERADEPFLLRIKEAIANAGEAVPAARVVEERAKDLSAALDAWKELEGEVQEARLFPLAQFMAEVFAGAVLAERAEWEMREFGDGRKSLVASLYVERYLSDAGPMRGIESPASAALEHFDELVAGALIDPRPLN